MNAQGEPSLPAEGSADAFIFQHYLGYSASTYRVEHPPWRTCHVTSSQYEIEGDSFYGPGFGNILAQRPGVRAMPAEGSAVTVFQRENPAAGRSALNAR